MNSSPRLKVISSLMCEGSSLVLFVAGHDPPPAAGNSTSAHWNASSKDDELAGTVSHHQVAGYAVRKETLLPLIGRTQQEGSLINQLLFVRC